MSRVPLARPALPTFAERIAAPRAVAIFGAGAAPFAIALASALRARDEEARVVRAELRRAEGASVEGDPASELVIHAAPDALVEALLPIVRDAPIPVGCGAAFAAAVDAGLSIWIRGRDTERDLGPVERELARRARLVLEEARPGLAIALAERIAGPG